MTRLFICDARWYQTLFILNFQSKSAEKDVKIEAFLSKWFPLNKAATVRTFGGKNWHRTALRVDLAGSHRSADRMAGVGGMAGLI